MVMLLISRSTLILCSTTGVLHLHTNSIPCACLSVSQQAESSASSPPSYPSPSPSQTPVISATPTPVQTTPPISAPQPPATMMPSAQPVVKVTDVWWLYLLSTYMCVFLYTMCLSSYLSLSTEERSEEES